MKQHQKQQKIIRLGTHGEDYGSWMSNPVFYMIGGLLTLSAVLAALSFSMFHIAALGVLFSVAAAALLALLVWITWIRKQYAFGGGGMMERVHKTVLAHLNFDGQGSLLEVGCGSGALSIRAALTWPDAEVTGIDYWGAAYGYGQAMCEKNAASEGVAARCRFQHGDANKLDFPDKSFDAVVSNYVYHNIMGSDKRALLLETLRVLKKGGVFALNDEMKPHMYGNMWVAIAPAAFRYLARQELGWDISALKQLSKQIYRQMVSRTPDIGSMMENPLRVCLTGGILWLSIYKAAEEKMSEKCFEGMVSASMRSPLVVTAFRGKAKTAFTLKAQYKRAATASLADADRNPFQWNAEVIFGRDAEEYTILYHQCGLCALGRQEGLPHLVPYLCALDTMSVDWMGGRLYRTKTLATGGDCCDFYICKKGSRWDKERQGK